MFEVLEKEMVISVCMFACLLLSLFARVFLGVLYQNMIRETDNMASTENKLLKQCKLKFANCFELSGGVPNVSVFVDKFINHLSLGHLSFGMLYHFSGQAMLLSVVFSGIGICRSIVKGRTLGDILPFYIVSFIGLYLYFSISTVVDIKSKRRTLKINLVDYLENHLSPRIDVTRQDMELLYGDAAFCEKPGKKIQKQDTAGKTGRKKETPHSGADADFGRDENGSSIRGNGSFAGRKAGSRRDFAGGGKSGGCNGGRAGSTFAGVSIFFLNLVTDFVILKGNKSFTKQHERYFQDGGICCRQRGWMRRERRRI